MSASLPERPHLDQLRRRAKELRDDARSGDAVALERLARQHRPVVPDQVSLAVAQLVIARELGFSSWPTLRAAIDAAAEPARRIEAFVSASVDGNTHQASEILLADPDIGSSNLLAAVVLGEARRVRDELAADPGAAVRIDEARGWPPLLYASYSRWHRVEPRRAAGIAEVVHLLLDAGANPNTNDGGRRRYRSALKGSVEVNNPAVTEVLLDAGASPDDGECIGEAVGHHHLRCLELLLSHGARVAGTWALGAAVWADDAVAMALLLNALAKSGVGVAEKATETLPEAAADASLAVVEALLEAGADPRAAGSEGSALRNAVRAGRADTAALLRRLGADDDSTDIDQFIGACLSADRQTAEQLLLGHPDLANRLSTEDRATIVDAAGAGSAEAIAVMLDLGFSTADHNSFGEQPLHSAAYAGNAEVVRLLLERGADVDARDARFGGTPLGFATVGSGEGADRPGRWVETVELLVGAGASRVGAWVRGKPPSEAVMELVQRYGLTADEPEQQPDDETGVPGTMGHGVMGDVARHIEAAYRHFDLDLLGSVLHPDVRWTGVCTDRAEVLGWYRKLLAERTRATVESVEVDRDAVVLRLSVSRQAEGARPAPPERLYQVFTVDDGQVVDIRAYPDRASVLARA